MQFKTGAFATLVAVVAAFVPIGILGEMVSIGTLLAFVLVCGAVIYLRRSDADVHRPFRVPGVPVVRRGSRTVLSLPFPPVSGDGERSSEEALAVFALILDCVPRPSFVCHHDDERES